MPSLVLVAVPTCRNAEILRCEREQMLEALHQGVWAAAGTVASMHWTSLRREHRERNKMKARGHGRKGKKGNGNGGKKEIEKGWRKGV